MSSNFTPDQSNKLLNIQKRCNRRRSPTTYTPRHTHMHTHTHTHTHTHMHRLISLADQTHIDAHIILKENATKRYKIPAKQQRLVPHTHAKTHQKTGKKNTDGGGVNNITVNLSKRINHTHISDSLCALILLLPTIRRCFRKFLWVEKSKQRRDNRERSKT